MTEDFIKSQAAARDALEKHQSVLNDALNLIDKQNAAMCSSLPVSLRGTAQALASRITNLATRAAKGENVEAELRVLTAQAKNLQSGSTNK